MEVNMYEFFIKKYIDNRLTKTDIVNFAKKEGIVLTTDETEILYTYIKKYWQVALHSNPEPRFLELKEKLRPEVYAKAIELYNFYKQSYFS